MVPRALFRSPLPQEQVKFSRVLIDVQRSSLGAVESNLRAAALSCLMGPLHCQDQLSTRTLSCYRQIKMDIAQGYGGRLRLDPCKLSRSPRGPYAMTSEHSTSLVIWPISLQLQLSAHVLVAMSVGSSFCACSCLYYSFIDVGHLALHTCGHIHLKA